MVHMMVGHRIIPAESLVCAKPEYLGFHFNNRVHRIVDRSGMQHARCSVHPEKSVLHSSPHRTQAIAVQCNIPRDDPRLLPAGCTKPEAFYLTATGMEKEQLTL